jgi:hypothetical protein
VARGKGNCALLASECVDVRVMIQVRTNAGRKPWYDPAPVTSIIMFSLEPGFLLQNHLKKVVLLKYLKCSSLLIYSTNHTGFYNNQNHNSGYLNDLKTHKPSYVSMYSFNSFLILGWSGTKSTTGLFYQPWMVMDNECGTNGGMIGREN